MALVDRAAAGQRRAAARLLRLAVSSSDLNAPGREVGRLLHSLPTEVVLQRAALHRVSGYVLAAARANGAPQEMLRALERASKVAVGFHLRVLAEMRLVAGALAEDVSWLVVKGPVLAGHAYPRADLRSYGDLDVLVPPGSLGRTVASLEGVGFTLLDRNWDMFLQDLPGEVHLRTPLGGMLDLHWHLQNDRRARDSATVRTSSLFGRRRAVSVGGQQVPTLDAEDTLLHLCLHAARSGGNRLVWLKDIQQVWWKDRPDPGRLQERAVEWGVELPVLVMLERARRTLSDQELAADFLDRARVSPSWRRFSRAVDRISPVEASGDGSSLTRVVARAVATDPPHAAREGARRSLFHLRSLGGVRGPAQTWDPSDPSSVVFEAGGPSARAAYFERVATQAEV